jgi:hypothetical protein
VGIKVVFLANAGIWLIARYFHLKQSFKENTTNSKEVPDVSGMTLDGLTEQYYDASGMILDVLTEQHYAQASFSISVHNRRHIDKHWLWFNNYNRRKFWAVPSIKP